MLSWDYDDQLVSTGDGYVAYAYDALGRQASRTAGGVTTSYLYDGDAVLLERQGSTTTAAYTYGNALLREGGATPLFDGQGSERAATDASGAASAVTVTAYGRTLSGGGGGVPVRGVFFGRPRGTGGTGTGRRGRSGTSRWGAATTTRCSGASSRGTRTWARSPTPTATMTPSTPQTPADTIG